MHFPAPKNRKDLETLLHSHPKLKPVYAAVRSSSHEDEAHNTSHLFRVALWTCRILGEEAHLDEAISAALLHDLVNIPKNHPHRSRASELSAEKAAPILESAGFAPEAIERICTAIRQHSFSRGEKPSSDLGKALQDADRLEALGAIGIMRVYSTGVRMGASYFHPDDPWAKKRDLDDKSFSLDHFFTKLIHLPATMNTPGGREEANARLRPMQAFLESLERELGENRP